MTISDPFDFHAGSLPLLISIPHAGTRLTPAVEAGLTEDAPAAARHRLAYPAVI